MFRLRRGIDGGRTVLRPMRQSPTVTQHIPAVINRFQGVAVARKHRGVTYVAARPQLADFGKGSVRAVTFLARYDVALALVAVV